ncbi:MAG: hypothetical protein ACOCUD_02020 [Bacillota bacterium]
MANRNSNINISDICPNTYWDQFYKEPSAQSNIAILKKKKNLLNR